jgi:hypothetical protein
VVAFEEWCPHLLGIRDPILVLTDHNNLQGFLTKRLLNRRQARWAPKLSEYNFKIVYRPGPKNAKADALTRRSGGLSTRGILKYWDTQVIRPWTGICPTHARKFSAGGQRHGKKSYLTQLFPKNTCRGCKKKLKSQRTNGMIKEKLVAEIQKKERKNGQQN